MATIINTPGNNGSEDSSGWAVAVVILIVAIGIGAFLWFQYGTPGTTTPTTNNNASTTNNSTNVQITLPASTTLPR